MHEFDESLLDDAEALRRFDPSLRELAGAGARVRIDMGAVTLPDDVGDRPRGVVVVGDESRLIRAVLERTCPVPLVAWSFAGLPAWVGSLDVVVALNSHGDSRNVASSVAEAARRGARVVLATPEGSVADEVAGRSTVRVTTKTGDPLAAAVVALQLLHDFGLGPVVTAETVADAADLVAQESSPHRNLAMNPAKELAIGLADAEPLCWGGSVLAARASRRIAEALREASGRPALSADASALVPVLEACRPRDPFEDPFEADTASRPVLVLVDDGFDDDTAAAERLMLTRLADAKGVRICRLVADQGSEMERYISLLQQGRYGAAYLALGLGKSS